MNSRLVLMLTFTFNMMVFSHVNANQLDLNTLTPSQLVMGQQFLEKTSKNNGVSTKNSNKPNPFNASTNNQKLIDYKQNYDPNIMVVEEKPSTLEIEYNDVDIFHKIETKIPKSKVVTSNKKLKQFGYSFFNYDSFNNNDLTIPESYLLQKGDAFTLFIYGKKEMILELSIDNQGEVFIPTIGPVLVAGLSITDANKKISTKLKRKFVNFESRLKINYLKDVTIVISGNVNHPGAYSINKYESIFSVLSRANGISKSGSLRNIKLLKSNGEKQTIDLYTYLLIDTKQVPITFNEGDVLFVPGLTDTVAITGSVNNPGIYEIKSDEKLMILLNLLLVQH